MNAQQLLEKLYTMGADKTGIHDRFEDNAELYELCFREFLDEPNVGILEQAVASHDYEKAFSAAHALKGLSGNLGLSGYYEVICNLVEDLRGGKTENIEDKYLPVKLRFEKLCALVCDEGEPASSEENSEGIEEDFSDKPTVPQKKERKRFLLLSIGFLVAAILLISLMFIQVGANYRKNVITESGQHLTEMSNQIKLYIEERISNDWKIAQSVSDSITDEGFVSDDDAILAMMLRKKEVWGVTDLMLYTERGYCVYTNGDTEVNDIASDAIAKARQRGKYMSVIDSRIIYTVPVDTNLTFGGEKIVAISVVSDMKTFLDDMNFSSFNEQAYMYLTEENGIVVSMLTNASAQPTFNFNTLLKDKDIRALSDDNSETDMFTSAKATAFLVSDATQSTYTVSVPISTGDMPLRLFYLAPEDVVNETTNGFSSRLTVFSMAIVLLFAVLAGVIFYIMYENRKKLFNKAIVARERMFDLLIANTKTAFALFRVDGDEPAYISNNAYNVLGEAYWTLKKEGETFVFKDSDNSDNINIRTANEMLKGWDGHSVFKSGYIKNAFSITPAYFNFQIYPAEGEEGDYVGIAQDVTADYERENAAKCAMEMSVAGSEAKSRFLSNMSHDIRTPMNAIMNMTNFALENIDNPKTLGVYLHTIKESGEHLLHLINDVLDMSRIESGLTVIAQEPFNIKEEIIKQLAIIEPLCTNKEITLINDCASLTEDAVLGDAVKLSQIIMNLLSNAVKFTPEKGAVRFTAQQIPSLRDNMVDVRFIVEDNGIGISHENIEHIFEPFNRANDKRVQRLEGTGLGLSICKNYVEAMGGTIRCESEYGEGSIFTVELFFIKAEQIKEESKITSIFEATPFLGCRALVVEDNSINRTIAKALLERIGFIVDFAEDGMAGVKKFLASNENKYDIIYMDIQMPVMDGYKATTLIRESTHPNAAAIPIVAMTANVFAEDIEKARIAGMDAYLCKPIVSFDLIEQTQKAMQKKGRN